MIFLFHFSRFTNFGTINTVDGIPAPVGVVNLLNESHRYENPSQLYKVINYRYIMICHGGAYIYIYICIIGAQYNDSLT